MLIEHAIARLAGLEEQAAELRAEIAQSHVAGFVDHVAALGPTWALARQAVSPLPVRDLRDMLAEALRQLAKHKNESGKLAVVVGSGSAGGKGVVGAVGGGGGYPGGGGGYPASGQGGVTLGGIGGAGGAGGGAVQGPSA